MKKWQKNLIGIIGGCCQMINSLKIKQLSTADRVDGIDDTPDYSLTTEENKEIMLKRYLEARIMPSYAYYEEAKRIIKRHEEEKIKCPQIYYDLIEYWDENEK